MEESVCLFFGFLAMGGIIGIGGSHAYDFVLLLWRITFIGVIHTCAINKDMTPECITRVL